MASHVAFCTERVVSKTKTRTRTKTRTEMKTHTKTKTCTKTKSCMKTKTPSKTSVEPELRDNNNNDRVILKQTEYTENILLIKNLDLIEN